MTRPIKLEIHKFQFINMALAGLPAFPSLSLTQLGSSRHSVRMKHTQVPDNFSTLLMLCIIYLSKYSLTAHSSARPQPSFTCVLICIVYKLNCIIIIHIYLKRRIESWNQMAADITRLFCNIYSHMSSM